MESSAARVASMMLRRTGNSRKNLGTLFSQWTARSGPRDPMRRMTMGGAAPPPEAAAPASSEPCADAFTSFQLPPADSLTRQESFSFLLSPMNSLTAVANGLLLSPAVSVKDGAGLLSPSVSVKANLESLLSLTLTSSRMAAGEEGGLLSCKSVTAPSQPSCLGAPPQVA